jgi:SET domain-containing protein
MNQSLAPGIGVARSKIDGKGCFATVKFCRDQQIAEYIGERISLAEAERRRLAPGKKSICDVDSEWSIDGSGGGNGTQYVNHSCEPNSYLVISEGRVFLHALREIIPGEEITIDYLYELKLDETECRCRMATCLETLNQAGITGAAQQASETSAHYSPTLITGPGRYR